MLTASDNLPEDKHNHSASSSHNVEFWTREGLIDDLFLQLCATWQTIRNDNGREIKVSKYYVQAWGLLASISVGEPPPYFEISLSDLPHELVGGLKNEHGDREYIISRAIGRIFENVSPRVYHLSIARRLRWRFVP
jgi:hypothetical protein